MKNWIFFFSLWIAYSAPAFTQSHSTTHSGPLFDTLAALDSLVFHVGFNQCDTAQLSMLISDDFEFYHDQNGVLTSKLIFLQNIPNLCKMNYKATRVLDRASLKVFPLYAQGNLYGAIQEGTHQFFGEEAGKEPYLTSTAIFTHVWIIENDRWQLKRILSYDHVVPGE